MGVTPRRDADFYFTAAFWDLAALANYHRIVEQNLVVLIEERGVSGGDDPETAFSPELEQIIIDARVPFAHRIALLLSLWSIYESAVTEVAEIMRISCSTSYSIRSPWKQIPEPAQKYWQAFPSRAKYYFAEEFQLPLFPDQRTEQQICEFHRLRNLLAHSGGRENIAKREHWERLEKWARRRRDIDLTHGFTAVTSDFVTAHLQFTHTALSHVVQQARDHLERNGVPLPLSQAGAARITLQIQYGGSAGPS